MISQDNYPFSLSILELFISEFLRNSRHFGPRISFFVKPIFASFKLAKSTRVENGLLSCKNLQVSYKFLQSDVQVFCQKFRISYQFDEQIASSYKLNHHPTYIFL